MIDIHSHLLPGVDDGAKDVVEAVAMAEIAAADGTTDIFLTSHLNFEYNYNPEHAARLLADLATRLPNIRLHSGCEVHLTAENIEKVLEAPRSYTLGGGTYLLVELPDQFIWWSIRAALERLADAGLRLIIAHPERNPQLFADLSVVNEMVEQGYLMQLTARSLTGAFGPESARVAEDLLRKRLVHFVASDGHSLTQRRPLLSPAHKHLAERFGTETADLLTRTNGLAVLSNLHAKSMGPARAQSLWSLVPKMKNLLGFSAPR